MERASDLAAPDPPPHIAVRAYDAGRDHAAIRDVYGAAFEDEPWPSDWDEFTSFTPNGVFVAHTGVEMTGFAICFPRDSLGYISVVAVRPEHQRNGIGSALVGSAVDFLRGKSLDTIRIDAFGDSPHAAVAYWALGFRVYDITLEA